MKPTLTGLMVFWLAIDFISASAVTLEDSFDDGDMNGWDLSGAGDARKIGNGELVVSPTGRPVQFFIGDETWIRKADMSMARSALATAVASGKIYAIGGGEMTADGIWKAVSIVECYDPAADNWIRKIDMPKSRWGLSAECVQNRIYAIGGADPDGSQFFSTVESYDPITDTWSARQDMPTKRETFSTGVVDGKIYAIGGWYGDQALPTVECYDPETDTWTRKADMPTPRAELSASVVNGRIYAVGGRQTSLYNNAMSTVEEYDPFADVWIRKADMPTARAAFSTSVVDGRIYAIGGRFIMPSVVEMYDPGTNTWSHQGAMPTARCCFSTSSVNGRIYAIGGSMGSPNCVIPIVEEYAPRSR